MARYQTDPEHLFDHTWRAGHPFRPRLSRLRRWGMRVLLALLCSLIGVYWYLTDSRRVRDMAETYLSGVLGAPVEVGGAHLSIFEGLRLDNVRVHVDQARRPEQVLLSAESFQITYNPFSIISGHLEATLIRAIRPHVRLVHTAETSEWNVQRLLRDRRPAAPSGPASTSPVVMPEIALRDAHLDVIEMSRGQAVAVGSIAMEGILRPGTDPFWYDFGLQARGPYEGIGPSLTGSLSTATGQVNLRLVNLQLGDDVRALCLAPVQEFLWERHKVAGRMSISELSYTPGRGDRPASFRVVTDLDGVTLTVDPQEWRPPAENAHVLSMRETFAALSRAGMNLGSSLDIWAEPFRDSPIRLDHVAGRFVFTEKAIEIQNLVGRVEANGIRINGRIDNVAGDVAAYSLAAPFDLQIQSLESEDLYLPPSPRYISALPPHVQGLYDRFRPQGTCRVGVKLARRTPGGEIEFDGAIKVVNGNFRFDRFPYPLREAHGVIAFQGGGDKPEKLFLRNLRGKGVERGPNSDSEISVNGEIGPLNDDAEVRIKVIGKSISAEPALVAAFPGDVRKAMRSLDAHNTGVLPVFHGDFECRIDRPPGPDMPWTIDTDVIIDRAHAALKSFPYPLRDVAMVLYIRDDYLEIAKATMRKGDATLDLSGKIKWAKPADGTDDPVIQPSLDITATNVPIDKDLLDAVPASQRAWLQKIALTGTIDAKGKITPAEADDFGWDVNVTLKDGSAWPVDGKPSVTGLGGKLHLLPQKIVFSDLVGKRGTSVISGHGESISAGDAPRLVCTAKATDLVLDETLRKVLPPDAQAAWEQVKPEGTVDADISFSGDESSFVGGPSTRPGGTGFEVRLRPKKLAITPESMPYRLADLAGEMTIRNDQVELKKLTGHHGKGTITVAGTIGMGDKGAWDLTLGGQAVAVDDDLRKALPETLLSLVNDSKLQGQVDFAFTKVLYRPSDVGSTRPTSGRSAAASNPTTAPADVDFKGEVTLKGCSLDLGVPLQETDATIQVDGSTRAGRLSELSGSVLAPTLKIAGRNAKDVRADLIKLTGQDVLRVAKLRGQLAGGEVAGQFEMVLGEQNAGSGYALNIVLRQADVAELTGERDKAVQGQLTASVSLEGKWGQPASQRGRGDVLVSGKEMYRVPVILGLLQITNLSLPISTPFTQGTARYSVQGRVVTIEQLELRSNTMTMAGSGQLNFDTRKVKMTFTTDNPKALKIPLINELMQGLRQELLQIQVNGSIEEPKVSGSVMNTFQTTIDEVFRPGDKK